MTSVLKLFRDFQVISLMILLGIFSLFAGFSDSLLPDGLPLAEVAGPSMIGKAQCHGLDCARMSGYFGIPVPLVPEEDFPFKNGDEFLVLNPASSLSLQFSAGGETVLNTIGSAVAENGARNFTADEITDSDESGESESKVDGEGSAAPHSLFFLGDSEVKVLSPLPGSVLLVQRFPHVFPMSLRVKLPKGDDVNPRRALQWNLVRIRGSGNGEAPRVSRVDSIGLRVLREIEVSAIARVFELSGEIRLTEPGRYGLIPSDRPWSWNEVRMRFEARDSSETLRRDLRKYLKRPLSEDSKSNIFIE